MCFCDISILFFCSVVQATLSSICAILLALPLAHFFYRFTFWGKRWYIALAMLFCIMPTKLVALCATLFWGNIGTGFMGIVLAHLMLNIPFAFYILHTVYEKLDTTLVWLAADSGATPWQCYKDVIVPILRPTIVSLFFLLFLLHFASYSIPIILGSSCYHHTPEIMVSTLYTQKKYMPSFLFWVMRLLIIIPLFFVHNRYAQQQVKISGVPKLILPKTYTPRKHTILWPVYFVVIGCTTVGPLCALGIRACDQKIYAFFGSVFSFVQDPLLGVCVYRVIVNSVLLALASAIGAVLVGFLLAALERTLISTWARMIFSLATVITYIIGSVGIGVLFAWLSSEHRIFWAPRIVVSGFIIGIVCHVILNYAFAYRIIRAQMVLYHADLHKSAQTLGASYKKALWTVALPFVSPSLLRAFGVCFGLSLTEVGAGTILAGTDSGVQIGLTIPMAIRLYRVHGNQEAVIGLSLILLGLVLLVTYLCTYTPKRGNV